MISGPTAAQHDEWLDELTEQTSKLRFSRPSPAYAQKLRQIRASMRPEFYDMAKIGDAIAVDAGVAEAVERNVFLTRPGLSEEVPSSRSRWCTSIASWSGKGSDGMAVWLEQWSWHKHGCPQVGVQRDGTGHRMMSY